MIFVVLISFVIYVIAGIMIYHNMYNMENGKRTRLIIYGILGAAIATIIITNICVSGIKTVTAQQLSAIKIITILLFSPINLIVSTPYIGHVLNEYDVNKIDGEGVKRKLIILAIVLIIIIIFEISYIKNFQIGLVESALKQQ